VLPRDHVFNVMSQRTIVLMQQAIFATIRRPNAD
jgi:hypothetical protein